MKTILTITIQHDDQPRTQRFWNSWRNFGGFGFAHSLQDFSAEAGYPAFIWRIFVFGLFINITSRQ